MYNIVSWQDSYSVGIPKIDIQHKTLFDIINKLWKCITQKESLEIQLALVGELENYTMTHFKEEEDFMRSIQFPNLEAHQRSHEAFTQRVAAEKANIENGGMVSVDLLHFLRDWLVNHIMVADKEYALYFHERSIPLAMAKRFFGKFFG